MKSLKKNQINKDTFQQVVKIGSKIITISVHWKLEQLYKNKKSVKGKPEPGYLALLVLVLLRLVLFVLDLKAPFGL